MDIFDSIELLRVVSDFEFSSSERVPNFSIVDGQKDGFILCVKAEFVSDVYRAYLSKVVDSRNLRMSESEGYLMIHG